MNNKSYAVLLVLAGVVCGILVVSLTSSPAAAKLPTEERVIAQPPRLVAPPVRPVAAAGNIRVYPAGMGGTNKRYDAYAYVVKDGELWYCEEAKARKVSFR